MVRKNLKKFRIDLGLKSKEMADKLGVTRGYYSQLENGKKDPTFGLMEDFSKLFNYDDIWFLFQKEK